MQGAQGVPIGTVYTVEVSLRDSCCGHHSASVAGSAMWSLCCEVGCLVMEQLRWVRCVADGCHKHALYIPVLQAATPGTAIPM